MSEPTAGTRVVSAVRSGKLKERWADPQYAEREKARLRAMSQEQRDALAFYRQHRGDAPPPATPPPPAADPPAAATQPPAQPSSPDPRRSRGPSAKRKPRPVAPSSTTPPPAATPPARGAFFLSRRK